MHDPDPRVIAPVLLGTLSWCGWWMTRALQRECDPTRRRDLTLAAAADGDFLRARLVERLRAASLPAAAVLAAGFLSCFAIIFKGVVYERMPSSWLRGYVFGYIFVLFTLPQVCSSNLWFAERACQAN